MIQESLSFETYGTGSVVKEAGFYICVPCGYRKYLKKGEHFPSCIKCLGSDRKNFRDGLELWEKN